MKLRRALSLRLHIKGLKIAWNVVKVGVHACLLKWVPKSTSNVKSEKKAIKVHIFNLSAKIAQNIVKKGVQCFRPYFDEV